jgi:hypothetical protein
VLNALLHVVADRIKATFAESYMTSRLAWSCLYQHKLYASVLYQGQSMLFWCKREVKWAAEYLLKAHIYKGNRRSSTWRSGDSLVLNVRPPAAACGAQPCTPSACY